MIMLTDLKINYGKKIFVIPGVEISADLNGQEFIYSVIL